MNLIAVERISKTYDITSLFSDVSFGIEDQDKIALVGRNGTGKSTILKLLAGQLQPDEGKIMRNSRLRLEYLPQIPRMMPGLTIMEQIFHDGSVEMSFVEQYQASVHQLSLYPDDIECQKDHHQQIEIMERHNLWNLEQEIKSILMQLGIDDPHQQVDKLSGGQKRRVALARLLIRPSDLLLLDEPTNHLDVQTIEWLEKKISQKKSAVLMVTHDRMFMDRICNRILELDQGRVFSHPGKFDVYLQEKKSRHVHDLRIQEKNEAKYAQELDWMRSGVQGRGTRQNARVARFEALEKDIEQTEDLTMEIDMPMARLGKKILNLEHISKSFGGRTFIRDFSYSFNPRDRIGIVGKNGTGKTTLLKLIETSLAVDKGVVDVGSTVKFARLSQMSETLDPTKTLLEVITEKAYHKKDAQEKDLMAFQWLMRFMFPAETHHQKVDILSGGEQRRLALLQILLEGPNVLLLDEPTNDLDIESLLILEDFISTYQGVVVAVSHDRTFLNKNVHSIWETTEDGNVFRYEGNYTSYLKKKRLKEKETTLASKDTLRKTQPAIKASIKISYQDKKDFASLETEIPQLEETIEQQEKAMEEPQLSMESLQALHIALEDNQKILHDLYEQWTALAEKMEGCD